MHKALIVAGLRTPFGLAGGNLAQQPVTRLGQVVLREMMERVEVPRNEIDEVIWGTGMPLHGEGNIARIIASNVGISERTPAYTVLRGNGSGLQAIASGWHQVLSGNATSIVVGAAASFSQHLKWLSKNRVAEDFLPGLENDIPFAQAEYHSLRNNYIGAKLLADSDRMAAERDISRRLQDAYAADSYDKASKAAEAGYWHSEIAPMYLPSETLDFLDTDENLKPEKKPSFMDMPLVFNHIYSSLTETNIAKPGDGAAALLMMEEKRAQQIVGMTALGRVKAIAFSGTRAGDEPFAPVYAAVKALQNCGMTLRDIQLAEIDELTAATVLGNTQLLGDKHFAHGRFGDADVLSDFDTGRVNVNGGAIALGNPAGVSTIRIVLSLLQEMKRRRLDIGIAAMHVGHGQGGAIILERV